jgi:hypothetical protein
MKNKEMYKVRGLSNSQFKTFADALSAANGDEDRILSPVKQVNLEDSIKEVEKEKKSKSININN